MEYILTPEEKRDIVNRQQQQFLMQVRDNTELILEDYYKKKLFHIAESNRKNHK